MNKIFIINRNLLHELVKIFFFTSVLFIFSVCVIHYFPEEKTVEQIPVSADSTEKLAEDITETIPQEIPEVEETVVDEKALSNYMKSAIIEHSNQEDIGLVLYRNIQTKTKVIWFYNQICGNKEITDAILEYADRNNIPISLAFALSWQESRYQPTAINKNNNESIDRGLFQLNSNSFPDLKEDDFFNPYQSAKYGLSHLRFCLDTAGNEIAALAMYNAGTRRVRNNTTPQRTLNYVSGIIDYQRGLDELFDLQIVSTINTSNDSTIAYIPVTYIKSN